MTQPHLDKRVSDFDKFVAQRVMYILEDHGISLRMAARLCGMPHNAFYAIKHDQRRFSVGEAMVLARVLGITIEELLGYKRVRKSQVTNFGLHESAAP
jgi:Cro/C1-type HTH DNA-binding domain